MSTSYNNAIKGYDEVYLDSTQDILGQAFDWVVNSCEDDLTLFADRFASSPIGHLFEEGCPKYVAGVNGAELANAVMESLSLPPYPNEPEFWLDKSPEYWVGWMLAYYQWRRKVHFASILQHLPISVFMSLYNFGHEMDEVQVAEILDARYGEN